MSPHNFDFQCLFSLFNVRVIFSFLKWMPILIHDSWRSVPLFAKISDKISHLPSPSTFTLFLLFPFHYSNWAAAKKFSTRVYNCPPPSRFILGLKRVPFVFSYNRNNNSLDQMLPKSDFVLSRVFDCLPTAQTKKQNKIVSSNPKKKTKKLAAVCNNITVHDFF